MKYFLIVPIFLFFCYVTKAQSYNPDAIYPIPAIEGEVNQGGINIFTGQVNDTFTVCKLKSHTLNYILQIMYNSRSAGMVAAGTSLNVINALGGYGWKLMDYPKIVQDGNNYYLLDGKNVSALQSIGVANNVTAYTPGGKSYLWKVFQTTNSGKTLKWEITKEDGTRYVFDIPSISTGKKISLWNYSKITEPIWHDLIQFNYSSLGNLSSIYSSTGDSLIFGYDTLGTGQTKYLKTIQHRRLGTPLYITTLGYKNVLTTSNTSSYILSSIHTMQILASANLAENKSGYLFNYLPFSQQVKQGNACPGILMSKVSPDGAITAYTYCYTGKKGAGGNYRAVQYAINTGYINDSGDTLDANTYTTINYDSSNVLMDTTGTYLQYNYAEVFPGGRYNVADTNVKHPYGSIEYYMFNGQKASSLFDLPKGMDTVAMQNKILNGYVYQTLINSDSLVKDRTQESASYANYWTLGYADTSNAKAGVYPQLSKSYSKLYNIDNWIGYSYGTRFNLLTDIYSSRRNPKPNSPNFNKDSIHTHIVYAFEKYAALANDSIHIINEPAQTIESVQEDLTGAFRITSCGCTQWTRWNIKGDPDVNGKAWAPWKRIVMRDSASVPDSCFTFKKPFSTKQWLTNTIISKRTPGGAVADSSSVNKAAGAILYASASYGNIKVATFTNAAVDSTAAPVDSSIVPYAAYLGFEPYERPGFNKWLITGKGAIQGYAHTGNYAFSGKASNTLYLQIKHPRSFILSGWCHVANAGDSAILNLYDINGNKLAGKYASTGTTNTGWIYMEVVSSLQPGQQLKAVAYTTGNGFIDDIRLSPIDAPFHANVYDIDKKLLTAEMMDNGETYYYVYNAFNSLVATLGPSADRPLQTITVPYNSRRGNRFINGIDSFDPVYPNMELRVSTVEGGIWEGFQLKTSDYFPQQGLSNMIIEKNGLNTISVPASASYNGIIDSSNFGAYAEVMPRALINQQEIGMSLQLDSMDINRHVINTHELKYVITNDTIKLYSGNVLYKAVGIHFVPGAISLFVSVMDGNSLIAYAGGRYLFEYTFLNGKVHGAIKLVSTNPNGSFDNFIYADQPDLKQQTFDALNRARQYLERKTKNQLQVTEILYGGPLSLPVAQTRPAILGGINADIGLTYKPMLAKGFDFDSLSIGKESILASASGYTNPFDITLGYNKSPLLEQTGIGGGGSFSVNGKAGNYTTFSYGEPASHLFNYYTTDLLSTTEKGMDGSSTIKLTNRDKVVFAEVTIKNGDTTRTQMQYDRAMRLKRKYQPNYYTQQPGASNFFTAYNYDFAGNVISITTPDAGKSQLVYNLSNQVRFIMDANGLSASTDTICYRKYDLLGRPIEEGFLTQNWNRDSLQYYADNDRHWPTVNGTFPVKWRKRYIYDGNGLAPNKGKLMSILANWDNDTLPEITESYIYNDKNQITEVRLIEMDFDTITRKVAYAYDEQGKITQIRFPGTNHPPVLYSYNGMGKITSVGIPGNTGYYATYSYDYNTVEYLNNGSFMRTYGFNEAGWETTINDPVFNEEVSYTNKVTDTLSYANGKVTGVSDNLKWNNLSINGSFNYDDMGRLTSANYGKSNPWSIGLKNPITYDENGNIQNLQAGKANNNLLQYTNGTNRLQAITGLPQKFNYNASGAVTSVPYGVSGIMYDPLSHLTTAINNGKVKLAFEYDGKDQRILKTVIYGNGKTQKRLYIHGLNDYPVMEAFRDSTGNITTNFYIYGPKGLIAIEQGTQRAFVIKDHLGSVRAIIDTNNKVIQSFNYNPLGLVTASVTNPSINLAVNYLYTGQEYDIETGLYNYRARLYDPGLGRFYSTDPEMQFPSPYLYAGNNPVSMNDPTGMWSWKSVLTAIIVAVAVAVVVTAAAAVIVAALPVLLPTAIGGAVGVTTIGAGTIGTGILVTKGAIVVGASIGIITGIVSGYYAGNAVENSGNSNTPVNAIDDGIVIPQRLTASSFSITTRTIQGYYAEVDLSKIAEVIVPDNSTNNGICPAKDDPSSSQFPYRVILKAPTQTVMNDTWLSYYQNTLWINANFFDVSIAQANPYTGCCTNILGIAMSKNKFISNWPTYSYWWSPDKKTKYNLDALVFYKQENSIGTNKKAETISSSDLTTNFLTNNVENAIGGICFLKNGKFDPNPFIGVVGSDGNNGRTAVGISDDGKKLLIIEIDNGIIVNGEVIKGVNFQNMADFFRSKGYNNAINMDGNGSSVFYYTKNGNTFKSSPMDNGPSYTHRPIPNFIGFK